MRTKIATALATVGLAALTVTALPGAAQANPEWYSAPAEQSDSSAVSPLGVDDCPQRFFCVWVNADYGSSRGQFEQDNARWTRFAQPKCPTGNWSDCASSGYNNGTSGLGVRVYEHVDYKGASKCLPKGWKGSTFTRVNWEGTSTNINDKISSNKWTAC
ncbi:peptidase inhibitor family I36 protein [Streptomyces sp. NPDC051243]|uniref:peptidase inhibitor family I36 protein n=1 Tax=Streptomyces sp. NPDC051243 TaxID=3365646 RepID=UPI0037A74654